MVGFPVSVYGFLLLYMGNRIFLYFAIPTLVWIANVSDISSVKQVYRFI